MPILASYSFKVFYITLLFSSALSASANNNYGMDISHLISREEFSLYKDVGEFIDHSPKVTVIVLPQPSDVAEYGQGVVKSLTGSDCNRDGVMDDNATCNVVFLKLWLKYKR